MRNAMAVAILGAVVMLDIACGAQDPVITAAPEVVTAPVSAPRTFDRPERERFIGMEVPAHEPIKFPNIRGNCEPGQKKICEYTMPPPRGGGATGPSMHCMEMADGSFQFNRADCATPLVVAWDEAPVRFTKPSDAAASFTIGPFARTEWVSASTPWLALDRDGSGCIEAESELFRFDRLRALDDNGDGRIDNQDAAYAKLVLWSDLDQDRSCRPSELTTLAAAGIVALQLDDVAPAQRPFGSAEGEHAALSYRDQAGVLRQGRLVDVYVAPLD